jgi:hypothetical protein
MNRRRRGLPPSPFTVTFEVTGVTLPFTSIESLVTVGDPEGELTTSSDLGAVSFPPPLSLFFCPAFPPPFPAIAARPAPTTKTTKNTPKHPRASRPVVQGPRGCASACSRGCVPASCCGGGGTGTSASGVDTAAVSWTGLPQFGQNLSSSLSSAPQFVQYLCAIRMLPLPMPRSVCILAPVHSRARLAPY